MKQQFLEREKEPLANSEPRPGANSLPPRSLSVLVLDEELPYPPDTGKRIRTWNLLRRLARRHRISLLCYGEPDEKASLALQTAGIRVYPVPPLRCTSGWPLYLRLLANVLSPHPYSVSKHHTRRFRNRLKLLLAEEHFDLVHCEWTPYARFLATANGLPRCIAAHNVESQIWFRRAQHSRSAMERIFFALQALKMRRFERRAVRHVDSVAAVSVLDAQQFRAWGATSVAVVENGVDLERFTPTAELPVADELLFVGSLDWYPNVDAVMYLLDEIMPLIRVRQPAAKLRIVGRRPPAALLQRIARFPWAEMIGEVEDVRPHLARAAVVAVPLRIGGGSRIKILEALAMGKAVVSTQVGAEGLAVVDGVHLRLADTPTALAQCMLDLLNSPGEQGRLGKNGRDLAVQRYGWDLAAGALESVWREVCAPKAAASAQTGSVAQKPQV